MIELQKKFIAKVFQEMKKSYLNISALKKFLHSKNLSGEAYKVSEPLNSC